MRLFKILAVISFLLAIEKNNAQSIGGAVSGSTAFCLPSNSGFVSLNGYNGTILHWQSSINNGQTWTYVSNQTSTQSYFNLPQTTSYRAVVQDASFTPDTSSVATITVWPAAKAGTVNGGGTFCMNSGPGAFTVNGKTGNILGWQKTTNNGTSWTSIASTSSTLPYSGITQNEGYRVIVENIPGCPTDTSLAGKINIDQNTQIGNLIFTDSLCINTSGEIVVLSSRTGTLLNWSYSYSATGTFTTLTTLKDTVYLNPVSQSIYLKAAVKNGVCPTLTTAIATVNVYSVNAASAGQDKTITQFEPVILDGSGNGTPEWNDINGIVSSDLKPSVSPFRTASYTLTITDAHGCKTYDSVTVTVIIPIPNTISPNNDGINDAFVIDKIEDYPNCTLTIFNRWGQMINTFTPYTNNWKGISNQGKDVPNDIYYYTLDYGTGEKPLTGFILIKR